MTSNSITTSYSNWASLVKNRTITLCGSTKFKHYFELSNHYLTLDGCSVFSVGHYPHSFPTDAAKEKLDAVHKHKIDLSDSVFVINPGGYIGMSTWSEIEFANNECKNIYFLDWQSNVILSPEIREKLDSQAVLEEVSDLLTLSSAPHDYVVPGAETRLRDLGEFASRVASGSADFDEYIGWLRTDPLSLGYKI